MKPTRPRTAKGTCIDGLRGIALLIFFVARTYPSLAQVSCSSVNVPIQPPFMSDGGGWNQPGYYSTIQTGDIDGDGQPELVARGSDGVHVWHIDAQLGVWRELASSPRILPDTLGWNSPQYYSTLRLAVLNPTLGQADLVVRGNTGIEVYRWDKVNNGWVLLTNTSIAQPFPDSGDNGTDWTKPQYYTTIQLGDIDGDGVPELIGRGRNGLEDFHWDEASHGWTGLAGGPFADADSWDKEEFYATLQLVTLHAKGKQDLVARAQAGVQVYEWGPSGWAEINASSLFSDANGFSQPRFYNTLQVLSDTQAGGGARWLISLANGAQGGSSASVDIYPWNDSTSSWGNRAATLQLPGTGWDQEGQYITVQGADIDADGKMEILARGSDGLHAFKRNTDGSSWSDVGAIAAMSDADGFTLRASYYTIQASSVELANGAKSIVLARAGSGIEGFAYTGGVWSAVPPPGFPAWANPQQAAIYQFVGEQVENTADIRSVYDDLDKRDHWFQDSKTIQGLPCTGTPAYCADFKVVTTELATEALYVDDLWNYFATNQSFLAAGSSGYLGQADVNIADVANQLSVSGGDSSSASVDLNWASMGANLAAGILSFVQPGASQAVSVLSDILAIASAATAGGGSSGNLSVAIANLYPTLEEQQANALQANACFQTAYLSNFGLLEPTGAAIQNNTIVWTPTDQANAILASDKSLHLWIWKTLAPAGWSVQQCLFHDNLCSNVNGAVNVDTSWAVKFDIFYHDGSPVMGLDEAWAFIAPNSASDSPAVTALSELTKSGGVTDPNAFNQNIFDMVYARSGWNIPGTPSCYLQTCPNYYTHTIPAPDFATQYRPALKAVRALLRAIRANREADSTQAHLVHHEAGRQLTRRLVAPVRLAQKYLEQASEHGASTPLTAADEMMQHFVRIVRLQQGSSLTVDTARLYLASAHHVRALLQDNLVPAPHLPLPQRF